jgi:nucleotide-binding universal stress UspA family protein
MFKNILLGVDGSEHALRAARLAGEMARLTNADLRIVVSFDPVPVYLGEPFLQEALSNRMKQADEILQPALDEVGSIPGILKTEILEGPPAEAILNVAEVRDIDLIVMGTRGRGRFTSVLLGSQSQKVVSHAACPVMLIR